ncbi:cytochrome P450 family protein [Longirhabdus pacifica]|uniref:cytochrome P450 family protein n=1 Tax=Longirhabdus pacifica TaxID=2305227 RepID=UPI00100899C0|nr:cytochrome P450 [Longirhabdus pacifica]
MNEVSIDIYSKSYQQNPYPTLTDLRKHDPVHSFTVQRGEYKQESWLISRYKDVSALFADLRLSKEPTKLMTEEEIKQRAYGEESGYVMNNMLSTDPPDHKRLRMLVHKVFTPSMIENLRGRITEITNELLDEMEKKEQCDLINDFAFPLPITVISEMMGIPAEDRERFRVWSENASNDEFDSKEEFENWQEYIRDFLDYMKKLVKIRSENPQDDIISHLVQAEEDGDKLSEEELYSTLFLLVVAGHETTVNLIGNGMFALFQHPEQLTKLKNNQDLMPTAIEEMLRYTNPVEFATFRMALEDIDLHDKQIKKGDYIYLSIAGANRDPEFFENADVFDITRENNKHLAFGYGIHFCLGAPLARLEADIALRALLNRFPNLALAVEEKDIRWRNSEIFRGITSLPVQK